MESPSAWARFGEGGKTGSQASRSPTAIEDMFSVCDKSRPDLPTRNAYRTIRGGRVARGVLRSRDFEDGKVAETSTMQAQCALLNGSGPHPRMARAGRPARSPEAAGYSRVARTCDGGADSPSCPRGQAGRCVTSRAMPAAGINADCLPLFLGRESLSDAERNLRVRLSETRP